MKRADIKVGFSCNNRCRFCVQGNKREIYPDKTTQEVKEALRKAKKENCQGVVFTGGEPTIRKDFLELVRYASNLKFKIIQIQTNGRMFAYKEFCKKTILAGANEFSPALHGHIPQLHDYLTTVKGSFSQTVRGIKNLKSLGVAVVTNTVITKSNYRHLPEIAKLLVKLGVDQFQFAFPHALGRAEENFDSIVPRKSLVEPFVKEGLDIGRKAGKRVMTEAIPLCFMKGYEDYIAEKIIPDTTVFERDQIINFTKARKEEGKTKAESCKRCKYFKICEGPWREYPEHFGWEEFKPVK